MEYLQWGDISCDKGGVGSLGGGGLVEYGHVQLGSYVGGLKMAAVGSRFYFWVGQGPIHYRWGECIIRVGWGV